MAKRFTTSIQASAKGDKTKGRSQGAPFIFEPMEELKAITCETTEVYEQINSDLDLTKKADPSQEEYMYM